MKLSVWELARKWGVHRRTVLKYLFSIGFEKKSKSIFVEADELPIIEALILAKKKVNENPFGVKGFVHVNMQSFTIKSIKTEKNNLFFQLVDSKNKQFEAACFKLFSKQMMQSFIAKNKKGDTITIEGKRMDGDNKILIKSIVQDGQKIGINRNDFHGIVKLWQRMKPQKRQ